MVILFYNKSTFETLFGKKLVIVRTYHNIGSHWIREGDVPELNVTSHGFKLKSRFLFIYFGDLQIAIDSKLTRSIT